MTKGFFLICKSKRHFSNIAIDQAHEQNDKLIKIDDGAIGIFENKSALLKWTVASLMVSDMQKMLTLSMERHMSLTIITKIMSHSIRNL